MASSLRKSQLNDIISPDAPQNTITYSSPPKTSTLPSLPPQPSSQMKTISSSKSNHLSSQTKLKRLILIEESKSLMSKYFDDVATDFTYKTNKLLSKRNKLHRPTLTSAVTAPTEGNNYVTTTSNNENDSITEAIDKSADTNKEDNSIFMTQQKSPNHQSITLPTITEHPKLSHKRTRTYQPSVDMNWKFKNGLTSSLKSTSAFCYSLINDIDYQRKVIEEQIRLLFDNILHFKQSVLYQKNTSEAFSYMTHKCKANLNKALEETIGILYVVPQLLLNEFFRFVENFDSIKLPNKEKLNNTVVTDEEKCFTFNNLLLTEMMEYFKGCQEVYTTLCNEIDKMVLKKKKFENVVCLLEKARYDISNAIMRVNNAVKHYNKDLELIEKMKKAKGEEMMVVQEKESLEDKMRNQFIFKKNEERQRIMRIKNALKNKYEDIEEGVGEHNNMNNKHKDKVQHEEFKSVIVSYIIYIYTYVILLYREQN